ncbi:glyoxylate reductase [Xanthoria calcicola]
MSESKPRVLLLGDIDHAPARSAYDSLSSLAHLITPKSTNPADFLQECHSGAFNGTKAIYRTFGSVSITGRIEGEVVKALAEAGVRFIAHNGAGYDQIDIPTCTAHKIHVSNTAPPALAAATADTALFLLLAALRNFNPAILSLRAGAWRGAPPAPLGHDPFGKTLGILGMGGIGRNLAAKAAALGMTVTYHNRRRLPPADEGGAQYVDFEHLLARSDVVSLNLPLNESTRGMIGKAEFAKMKQGAVVVNTARGGVVDEAALVEALSTSQISSCGLDVYENEPEIHPGLVGNPKVMLLPHMGTWTVETQTEMELWTIANVRSALETGKLTSPVAEQEGLF